MYLYLHGVGKCLLRHQKISQYCKLAKHYSLNKNISVNKCKKQNLPFKVIKCHYSDIFLRSKFGSNIHTNSYQFFICISSFYLGHKFQFPSNGEIPDYLREVVSEVSEQEENEFFEENDIENDMEDEIIDSLYLRAIHVEESDGSFTKPCPSCGHLNETYEIFIDRNTGYSVCPWCLWEGNWQEFKKLIDAKEDTLEQQELENYISDLQPINKSHKHLLSSSPFMNITIKQLQEVETGISKDSSRLVIPLRSENNNQIGFASISLLQAKPEVVRRVLKGKTAIFWGLPSPNKRMKRVVIVSTIWDALYLAKFQICAVALIADPKVVVLNAAFKNFKKIVLWMQSSDIPRNLLLCISQPHIDAFSVRLTKNVMTLTSLSESQCLKLIADTIPVPSETIITSSDISNDIYDRILKKEELFGVKWTRFTELNELLMGLREGELTIFSGLTGSGKTTFMSEYSLDLCSKGVRTLWASFEVNIIRLCEIMIQQYFGKSLPENYSEFSLILDEFSHIPMHFLNIHGQQPLSDVIDLMTKAVLIQGVRHVVIDNLQFMLGQHGANMDWWLEQDRAVGAFRQFATAYNCHVTLVVHPRKLGMGEKLNLHSISGGARVTQEADNIMILHVRENKDGTTNDMGPKTLQVVKNRYGGTLGEMKLKFHKPSLTLSSYFRKSKTDSVEKETGGAGGESLKSTSIPNIKGIPMLDEH